MISLSLVCPLFIILNFIIYIQSLSVQNSAGYGNDVDSIQMLDLNFQDYDPLLIEYHHR